LAVTGEWLVRSFRAVAPGGKSLDDAALRDTLMRGLEAEVAGEHVLVLVPDRASNLPIPRVFSILLEALHRAARIEVMVARGPLPPFTDDELTELIGMDRTHLGQAHRALALVNHAWQDPDQLRSIGSIAAMRMREIAGELWHPVLGSAVDVRVNRVALEADRVLIVGPTSPHDVAGYSGGAKYLFPGISDLEMHYVQHWLGFLGGVMATIGRERTPVRSLIDEAAALLPTPIGLVAAVTDADGIAGLFLGDLDEAWRASVELAGRVHVAHLERPVNRAISCALARYDQLWTAGRAMYMVEPALVDGGELIVYAPHVATVGGELGHQMLDLGCHALPYFLDQWERFGDVPLAVLARSTHWKGAGSFGDGIEHPRIEVKLASAIPAGECARLNLGYVDPDSIDFDDLDDDVLVVPNSGETLYRVGGQL